MTQTEWGWLVVIYLFLGGLGAGAFLVASVIEWLGIRYRYEFCPITLAGAGVSGAAVAFGSFLLILDLGAGKTQPWRILWMFMNPSSVMTWGIWILSIFIPLGLLYGLVELLSQTPSWDAWFRKKLPWFKAQWREVKRPLTIVGSVFAVATAIYTGVLISAVGPAVPFWSAPVFPGIRIPILPMLFLTSAILTGIGLVFGLVGSITLPDIIRHYPLLPVFFLIFIGLEAALVGLHFLSASHLGQAGLLAVNMIVSGPLSVNFWAFEVIIGFFLPFIVNTYAMITKQYKPAWGIVSGAGILIAGLSLRYTVIFAGVRAFL